MLQLDSHIPWVVLLISFVFSAILFVFICVCWKGKKRQNQTYFFNSDRTVTTSILATNNLPQIALDKQKYFLHDVKYSSINHSDLANSCNVKSNDHFSYNILSIFKNIQQSKFIDMPDNISKVLVENLEDSSTDAMHKTFDKSVLSLQWNESPESNRPNDRDETYSCISNDSKTTFTSVHPFYNRSYSLAETFKSTNSNN